MKEDASSLFSTSEKRIVKVIMEGQSVTDGSITEECNTRTSADSDSKQAVKLDYSYSDTTDSKWSRWLNNAVSNQCFAKLSIVMTILGAIVLLAAAWVLLFLLLGKEVVPEGCLFQLVALVIIAQLVGSLMGLAGLPPLLGMLITGIVAKSLHLIKIHGVYTNIVSTSRDVALTVILIKAGLGLDPAALRAHVFTILSLALGPCLAEAVAASVATHFIFDYPWLWSFLQGFLLSPISPAVVVPTLLNLKEMGYGEDKGIATLVIAASSIDDIFSISLFGIFLSIVFKNSKSDSLAGEIAHGPLEVIIGIGAGILWGLVCAFIPHRNDEWVKTKRSLMVGLGGLVQMLGSEAIGYSGAGSLAVITSTLIAAICWRQQTSKSNSQLLTGVPAVFSAIWLVVQPILFSLIGAMIDLTKLNWSNLAYSLAVIFIALFIRVCICIAVTFGSKLNWKEKLFVNLAWLPKATVQAALSPLPLMKAKSIHDKVGESRGEVLLTTAVLAILITAPLGSLGISISGPKLLGRKTQDEEPKEHPLDPESHL